MPMIRGIIPACTRADIIADVVHNILNQTLRGPEVLVRIHGPADAVCTYIIERKT